jgi:hypothetical protein
MKLHPRIKTKRLNIRLLSKSVRKFAFRTAQLCRQCLAVVYYVQNLVLGGTAVAQWLRYCATNRKVAGSIPDGDIAFFIDVNPSDRTMAVGSTQPLTEMSTRSISWGWMRPVRKADNLTTILCRCHKIWEPLTSWNRLGHPRPVTGLLYPYLVLRSIYVYLTEAIP